MRVYILKGVLLRGKKGQNFCFLLSFRWIFDWEIMKEGFLGIIEMGREKRS